MTRDHTTIEALLAVQALGGLDGDDEQTLAAERASHGDCEECTRLEAEFSETAGRLAFSLDPMPVDAAMADRILAASPVVVAEPAAPMDELGERRQRRGRGWQAAAAVAAVIAVLLVAVAVVRPDRTTAIASASTTQRLVEFSGSGEGELAVAFTPGESGAVLWGSNLPDPGQDKVYEIWMIQDGTPVSGGCFRPQDGQVALSVDASLGGTEAMALTAEPEDCPSSPSGQPVKTANLTLV
jgi:Anti-sigma-K factor rskA, C-terminal